MPVEVHGGRGLVATLARLFLDEGAIDTTAVDVDRGSPFTVEQLDAAADELADGEARLRHALETIVDMIAGGDIDAALDYGKQVLRG